VCFAIKWHIVFTAGNKACATWPAPDVVLVVALCGAMVVKKSSKLVEKAPIYILSHFQIDTIFLLRID
jgi:hypothetical protein